MKTFWSQIWSNLAVAAYVVALMACSTAGSSQGAGADGGHDVVQQGQDLPLVEQDAEETFDAELAEEVADSKEGKADTGPLSGLDTQAEAPQDPDAGQTGATSGWASGACTTAVQGTGNEEGDIAHDFSQMDQFGNALQLHDYCDKVVLLIGSAYW